MAHRRQIYQILAEDPQKKMLASKVQHKMTTPQSKSVYSKGAMISFYFFYCTHLDNHEN